jgi:hypothetical protein
MVALYKPESRCAEREGQIDRDSTIRRIEWLDRSLNALSPQEFAKATITRRFEAEAARRRRAQGSGTAHRSHQNKDEEAIRAAKRVVSNQRKRHRRGRRGDRLHHRLQEICRTRA